MSLGTGHIRSFVMAAEPTLDEARAVVRRWRTGGVDPGDLADLSDHLQSDGRLGDGFAVDQLLTPAVFLRLAGAAAAYDPKTLLVAAPDGRPLDSIAAVLAADLVSAATEGDVPLVHRPPEFHSSSTAARLAASGLKSAVASAELQTAIWSGLRGAVKIAQASEECGSVWCGPDLRGLQALTEDLAAATVAVFCPPWHPVSGAAYIEAGDLVRLQQVTPGLAHMLEAGLGASSKWMYLHAARALRSLTLDAAGFAAQDGRLRWAGELGMVADVLAESGFEEEANSVNAELRAELESAPIAFWSSDGQRGGLSAWAFETALARGVRY